MVGHSIWRLAVIGQKLPHLFSLQNFKVKFKKKRKPSKPAGYGYSRHGVELLEPRQLLSFTAPVNYTFGTTNDGFVPNAAPQNIVTADFNGDGKLDLAVAK